MIGKTKTTRQKMIPLVLVAAVGASFATPGAALAQRRGGVRASARPSHAAARPSNAEAFRAGRSVGRRQGYTVGASRGYAAGAHAGYHAGYNHGAWAHPWAYRAPTAWAWHPAGYVVATIATTAVVVAIVGSAKKEPSAGAEPSGGNVYYDQGVYYEQTADGYKVIPPPPGAQIASLPEGYTQVTQAGKQYGYYQGTFYVESNGEYVVTQAPTGAIVPYIPDSATETTKDDGTKLYEYAGTEFQAVSLSGDTSYVVSNS